LYESEEGKKRTDGRESSKIRFGRRGPDRALKNLRRKHDPAGDAPREKKIVKRKRPPLLSGF